MVLTESSVYWNADGLFHVEIAYYKMQWSNLLWLRSKVSQKSVFRGDFWQGHWVRGCDAHNAPTSVSLCLRPGGPPEWMRGACEALAASVPDTFMLLAATSLLCPAHPHPIPPWGCQPCTTALQVRCGVTLSSSPSDWTQVFCPRSRNTKVISFFKGYCHFWLQFCVLMEIKL